MTEENGVLARIGNHLDKVEGTGSLLDSSGKNEYRVKKHTDSYKEAQKLVHSALKAGRVPGYDPEKVPDSPSDLTREQTLSALDLMKGGEYAAAVNELYDNKNDVLAKIGPDGVEYLSGTKPILERSPHVKQLAEAEAAYNGARKIVEELEKKDGHYADVLAGLEKSEKDLLLQLASQELERDVNSRYKTPALRQLALEAGSIALKTGRGNQQYFVKAAKYIVEGNKKALDNLEKAVGGSREKIVKGTLEGMIEGSTEDVRSALSLARNVNEVQKSQKRAQQTNYGKAA